MTNVCEEYSVPADFHWIKKCLVYVTGHALQAEVFVSLFSVWCCHYVTGKGLKVTVITMNQVLC